jgi:peptide-methionine (S)-S-oxide reductase
VCNGTTGHAEVVQIEFDESEISFADLAEIHLTTHNPTDKARIAALSIGALFSGTTNLN